MCHTDILWNTKDLIGIHLKSSYTSIRPDMGVGEREGLGHVHRYSGDILHNFVIISKSKVPTVGISIV